MLRLCCCMTVTNTSKLISAAMAAAGRRSVSYVPAAYYAHLAAFRGRLMKREADEGSMVSSGSGSGERGPEVLQIPVRRLAVCVCWGGGGAWRQPRAVLKGRGVVAVAVHVA